MSAIEPSWSTASTPGSSASTRSKYAAKRSGLRGARRGGDSHAAEDVAQDAFIKLYRYPEASPRPIGNPAALLRTTTVNLCRTWHTRLGGSPELRMTRHGPDPTTLTGGTRTRRQLATLAPRPTRRDRLALLARPVRSRDRPCPRVPARQPSSPDMHELSGAPKGTAMKTDELRDHPDTFEKRLHNELDHIAHVNPVSDPDRPIRSGPVGHRV